MPSAISGRSEVKNSGPKDQALTSSGRGDFTLRRPMEKWNGGIIENWSLKSVRRRRINLCLTSCIEKKDLILLNPLFQSSDIPLFLGIGLRHSQSSPSWPRGPGFKNQNKCVRSCYKRCTNSYRCDKGCLITNIVFDSSIYSLL